MDLETITAMTKDIGFITPKKARRLYDFLLQTKPNHWLELGHAHGSSSCVIAAALDELGSGHLTTVDLLDAQFRDPNLEHLLSLSGLEKYVNIQREKNSYTWFLKKTIEANSTGYACQPLYDFCYIDGPKNWTIAGLAFF